MRPSELFDERAMVCCLERVPQATISLHTQISKVITTSFGRLFFLDYCVEIESVDELFWPLSICLIEFFSRLEGQIRSLIPM